MDYLLDTLPPGWTVVCVGEERPTTRSVGWSCESPAGGGPVAGIAAGLRHLEHLDADRTDAGHHDAHHFDADRTDAEHDAEICVVLGGDMPFAAAALPALIETLRAQPRLDAVLAADPDGRRQPLLAAYRCEALRTALPIEPGGARLMSVLDTLVTGTVACEAQITLDVDTPETLEQARHIVGA